MKDVFKLTPVRDIDVRGKSVSELVESMYYAGGFSGRNVSAGVDVLKKMCSAGDCLRVLSFPACIIATGTRGVIRDLVKEKLFDVVVTTCGTLDHDLARLWGDYFLGDFLLDDRLLHRRGVNRLGNVLIPNECYGMVLEEKLQPLFGEMYNECKEWSGYEFIWRVGRFLEGEARREESIVYWCFRNRIPVVVPGFFDGAFGSQVWLFWQQHRDFRVNLFLDEQLMSDVFFGAKKAGALMVGGGISKHHTIWWAQFRGGLDYGVYVTTAVEYDGSLSGARLREAISWGKLKERADHVTVDGDATVVLPLMVAALFEFLGR